MLVTEREMSGAGGGVPFPERETVRVASSGSSLLIVNVADFAPASDGENVTVTSRLLPASTENEAGEAEKFGWFKDISVIDNALFP